MVGSRPPGSAAPEQHVGERVAELLPGEPGEQHGGDLVGPRQQHGRAGVDDHDRARVGRGDAPHELVLAAGQRERRAVEALALDLLGRADDDDRDVGVAGQRDRALDPLVVTRVRRQEVELEDRAAEVDVAARRADLVAEHDADLLAGRELHRVHALRRAS